MTGEEWREVGGAPGYEVSSLGRVRSFLRDPTGRMLVLSPNSDGYLSVGIRADQHQWTRPVHRLVGEAFLGPMPAGLMTRHMDGDQTNNRADNLRYGTNAENQLDSVRHGTCLPALVVACPRSHPYDDINTYVTPSGKRDCRTCRREAARRYRARLRAAAA